jgi:flavin reductase (DIM6/NTAB) family NADH-FMN oxidoreductase RutF
VTPGQGDVGQGDVGQGGTGPGGAGPGGTGGGAVDQARFRQVLGHFATGVTIVTTIDEDGPAGMSVNSFTSVSLDPPLVAFCVGNRSTTWPRIQATGAFCVNVLGAGQEALARLFAGPAPSRFTGLGWRPSPSGAPLIDGALAWVEATVEAVHPAGDHTMVIGRARHLDVAHEGGPLVFFRGGYGRFES